MDDGRKLRLLMAASLVCIGIAGRLAFRGFLPHGNELVAFDLWVSIGAVSVLAGSLLGRTYGIAVPLLAMGLSDLYINTTLIGGGAVFVLEIAIFTWTGFAMVGILSSYFGKNADFSPRGLTMLTGTGLAGVLVFDVWTNFGVWLGPFYAHNAAGLALCFTMALPFTIGHLISTAMVLPVMAIPYLYLARTPHSTPEDAPDSSSA
jgi:hypothetical protein